MTTRSNDCTRRGFLQAASGASLAAIALGGRRAAADGSRVIGANERIRIGIIGCGDRGRNAHMTGVHKHAKAANVEIIAVCDPWRVAREMANAKVKEWFGRDARQFVSYRDLLALKDVDAVMIASCDHQHTTHLEAAAKAGKHVYVREADGQEHGQAAEGLRRRQGRRRGRAGRHADPQPARPSPAAASCSRSGVLGKASRVEQCRNAEKPYWYHYLKDVRGGGRRLGRVPHGRRPSGRSIRAVYSGWYGYREFSDGPIPGLGSHFIDLVHYITGRQVPARAASAWAARSPGRTSTSSPAPTTSRPCGSIRRASWSQLLDQLRQRRRQAGIRFFGDQGTLDMQQSGPTPIVSTQGAARSATAGSAARTRSSRSRPRTISSNWLQCLRSGSDAERPDRGRLPARRGRASWPWSPTTRPAHGLRPREARDPRRLIPGGVPHDSTDPVHNRSLGPIGERMPGRSAGRFAGALEARRRLPRLIGPGPTMA